MIEDTPISQEGIKLWVFINFPNRIWNSIFIKPKLSFKRDLKKNLILSLVQIRFYLIQTKM